MTVLSDRLKLLRKQKDLTQEQLADYMCVSPQAVSRWETGATSPDISALPMLADLFGITVDELLGVNETEKRKEISSIIAEAEREIDHNVTEGPIVRLREALNRFPNNDRLLTCLMYALFAACEDEECCRKYDAEIVSIAYRIDRYSTDNACRNEARRLLFRHYCETNRKAEARQIAEGMAKAETSYERNLYWALDGEELVRFLKERTADDLRELLWDLWAYSVHAGLTEKETAAFDDARKAVEDTVNRLMQPTEA